MKARINSFGIPLQLDDTLRIKIADLDPVHVRRLVKGGHERHPQTRRDQRQCAIILIRFIDDPGQNAAIRQQLCGVAESLAMGPDDKCLALQFVDADAFGCRKAMSETDHQSIAFSDEYRRVDPGLRITRDGDARHHLAIQQLLSEIAARAVVKLDGRLWKSPLERLDETSQMGRRQRPQYADTQGALDVRRLEISFDRA